MVVDEEKYRKELAELRREHDDLDKLIKRTTIQAGYDELRVQRMKKRKLWLRDRIRLIEKWLYPDIIA